MQFRISNEFLFFYFITKQIAILELFVWRCQIDKYLMFIVFNVPNEKTNKNYHTFSLFNDNGITIIYYVKLDYC